MSTVSLFSGCGGLDFGMEAAGWNIAYRNDSDRHSCDTLELNRGERVQCAPIEEVSSADIRAYVGTAKNSVDLVIGGPPCQPFSKSAYWSRGDTLRLKDPRANTLNEYLRVVEELKPKAFLLENVHGISYSGKEEGFQFLIRRIREINRRAGTDYRPTWRVISAADYGVPQLRIRFFLVGLRSGKEFMFPSPTHGEMDTGYPTLFDIGRSPYATAWDALAEIRPEPNEDLEVGGKWGKLLPSIPEGENYLWHTNRKGGLPLFGWRTRYWCFLLKLAKDRPSWTIQAQPGSAIGPFHWDNRKLSWEELAALQTFPRNFRIDSPRVEVQRQIGNAVPSLLAEVLGRALREQVCGGRISEPLRLAVPRRGTPPPPEPTQDVPRQYLALIGDHAPHPGTGKGRSYQSAAQQQHGADGAPRR
jgi:DNA (cytosine-5)-methyltransferase 1